MKVNVECQIEHVKSNLSVAEKNPEIFCFLDANFDRDAIKVPLKKKSIVSVTGFGTPSVDSSICFNAVSWRNGQLQDNGVAYIKFEDILTEIHRTGSYSKEHDLIMYTANNFNKGTIKVTIKELQTPNLIPRVGDEIVLKSRIDLLGAFIERTMQIEQKMIDRFPGTERMRMPYDLSNSGMQSTNGMPLPSFAYGIPETPKSNLHYWENAYKTIMARDDLKPEEWHRLNVVGKARATILTICYATHYIDYVSDTVDTNIGRTFNNQNVKSIDNWGDAGVYGNGDCEDLGNYISQNFNAFLDAKFEKDSVLTEMQEIARHYVPPLNLDVVHGAQASDKTEHLGAHMNNNFIPVSKFRSWLEKTKPGRDLSKTLPWPQETINSSQLPFLVGEGTGMYEPLGFEYPLMPAMGYVYSAPSVDVFKKPILHKKGETGPFFLGSLCGMTDYFYRLGSRCPNAFWYATYNEKNQLARGVSYEDLMNDHDDRLVILPQPEPSKEIMEIVKDAVSRRIPPNPLYLSEKRNFSNTNHHLDRLCKTVSSWNRKSAPESHYVPLYIRPHLLNDQVIANMIQDFRQRDRIWKVDYKLEEITDMVWGFRTKVYVKMN